MANSRDIVVKLIGDNSSLNRSLKESEGALGGFGVSLAKVGGILAAGFAGSMAIDFLSGAARAAADDAREQEILATTLQNVTGATEAQVAANEKWITQTQNATGIIDSQLRPALQNLIVATGDLGQAQTLMTTAMDIAVGKGLDLESVTKAMAKAMDGSTGALSKLGIEVKDVSGNVLTFDQIVQNANQTFGGDTAAAADTAAGKLAIMNAKWDDLKETIGSAVIPAMAGLVDFLNANVFPALDKVAAVVSGLVNAIGPGVAVMINALGNTVAGAINVLIMGVNALASVIDAITPGKLGRIGQVEWKGISFGGGGGAGGGIKIPKPGEPGFIGPVVPGTGITYPAGFIGPKLPGGTSAVPQPGEPGFIGPVQRTPFQQQVDEQNAKDAAALKAYLDALNASAGGGGGGKKGGKTEAEKRKEADDKAIAETLKIWANYRDNMREIEDNMYDNEQLSYEQYKDILEKRLATAIEGSDEWTAIQKRLVDVTKKYNDEQVRDAQKRADDLKKIQDQQLKDQEDALRKQQEIQDNMYEVGAISVSDYIAILQDRLAQFEQFSDEWTRIYEEIVRLGGNPGSFSGGNTGYIPPGQQTLYGPGTATNSTVINIATITVPDPRGLVDTLQQIDRTYGGVPINVRTPA